MSDSIDISANPTNSELVGHVVGAVEAVQDAQREMVEGVRKLAEHSNDPNAHGITDKNSPFYQAIKEVAGATGKRCTAVVDTMPEGEELAALKESMADDGFLYVKDEDGAGGGSGSTTQALLEKIAKLEEEIKKRGVYNDQIIIEESGEWIAPVTGWYEVTVIGGGNGAWIEPNAYEGRGGESGHYNRGTAFLKKGDIIAVTIGAAGRGVLNNVSTAIVNGGRTSFGSIYSDAGGDKRFAGFFIPLQGASSFFGGGFGGGILSAETVERNSGRWFGAGGGGFYNSAVGPLAGNGYQGAVILRFYNPDKDPITETE